MAIWGICVLSLWGQMTYAQAPEATLVASESQAATDAMPSQEDLARWSRPMEAIQARVPKLEGTLPVDGATNLFRSQGPASATARNWSCLGFCWCPSELAHQPLYFDDVPLEHYGQTACPLLQPAFSGARFFGTLPLMPYKLLVDPPCECVSEYGYYRPGSPTPCMHQRLP